jgi:hypothetical protein
MSEPIKSKFFDAEEAKKLQKKSLKEAKKVQREVGDVLPFVNDLDLPSVAVGFALSLVVFLTFAVVKKSLGLVFKLALLALIVGLLGGAYFGWLRRASGLGDDALASPQELIDDAKRAASDYQKKLDGQEKTLKKIEESAR